MPLIFQYADARLHVIIPVAAAIFPDDIRTRRRPMFSSRLRFLLKIAAD